MMFLMPIRLKFPMHMQDRIQERGIQAEHLREAINNPDSTKQVFEGRIKILKTLEDGKEITVIYYREDFKGTNDYFIITAYYK